MIPSSWRGNNGPRIFCRSAFAQDARTRGLCTFATVAEDDQEGQASRRSTCADSEICKACGRSGISRLRRAFRTTRLCKVEWVPWVCWPTVRSNALAETANLFFLLGGIVAFSTRTFQRPVEKGVLVPTVRRIMIGDRRGSRHAGGLAALAPWHVRQLRGAPRLPSRGRVPLPPGQLLGALAIGQAAGVGSTVSHWMRDSVALRW